MQWTEIDHFARKGDLNALEKVLKKSSLEAINEKESGMWFSALASAVLNVKVQSVELLLKYGADPNSKDKKGKTPLFYVGEEQPVKDDSPENRLKIAQLLLEYKANIDVCDDLNNQALFYVVLRGRDEKLSFAELFLKYGADPNHKNRVGNSPLDLAKNIEDKKLIELLENYTK